MADNYGDAFDPEKLIQCPYDKNHQIRACRFPYHLVKCRKNHPDIVQQLVTCPFNARHQVPRAEIGQHIANCDNKSFIEQDIASTLGTYRRDLSVVSTWQSPPCEEDWDKDLEDESKSAFIWGVHRYETNRTESSTTLGLKNHLPSSVRVPRSLPYVLPWKSSAGN
ncbi:gametocyte-specific factor 1-like [Sphaerodactylus townsendi]|uniref:gametocyte-specific factor 1-like n=1 Tax=Sphaerodactylus townsendi TaxID=933632 RepID=UPI0020275EB9|nr:gametocyte-specific factor 1-like [Sphaerodactylus townsendi]